ncbi:MAG: hypothetical protein OXD31_15565, partial [Chloroflexi bacterium]|nr:hypothetical protein [Chloroflexota bacterium]
EVFRGTAADALDYFNQPRGEFTLVIAGGSDVAPDDASATSLALSLLEQLRTDGAGARHAVEHVTAVTGLSRRKVYRMWLDAQSPRSRRTAE